MFLNRLISIEYNVMLLWNFQNVLCLKTLNQLNQNHKKKTSKLNHKKHMNNCQVKQNIKKLTKSLWQVVYDKTTLLKYINKLHRLYKWYLLSEQLIILRLLWTSIRIRYIKCRKYFILAKSIFSTILTIILVKILKKDFF